MSTRQTGAGVLGVPVSPAERIIINSRDGLFHRAPGPLPPSLTSLPAASTAAGMDSFLVQRWGGGRGGVAEGRGGG